MLKSLNEIDLVLSQITFLSVKEKDILRKNLDSLTEVGLLSIEDIEKLVGRTVKTAVWDGKTALAMAQKCAFLLENYSISCIRHDDKAYPALLREVFNPPYMLFYRGKWSVLSNLCVSVVGTRNLCRQCAVDAFDFAKDAARDGMTVISGLASGSDAFAHRGALVSLEKGFGATAAVLPCGMDTVTPHAHTGLAKRILNAGGLLLSEYPPGVFPEPWRYVQRNRIIAGLSPATLVVQAPPGSGALITADFALENNRDLFFLKSAFCQDAKKMNLVAEKKLKTLKKANLEAKLFNVCERYVADGALVIENYNEYLLARALAPGKCLCKYKGGQLDLF